MLALACIASLPALRAPLLMAALALEHASGGHFYALSLAEDASHFDLVLSHEADQHHEDHGSSPSCSEADHVVHLCADPVVQKSERRIDPCLAAASPCMLELPLEAANVRVANSWRPAGRQAADLLRSVVIRC